MDRAVARRNIFPVPQVPYRLEKFRLVGTVLQIVGMLPGIEHQQRDTALRGFRLMIVNLNRKQAVGLLTGSQASAAQPDPMMVEAARIN